MKHNNLHAEIVIGDWDHDRGVGRISVSINPNIPGLERYENGNDDARLYKFKGKFHQNVRDVVMAILRDLDPDTVAQFEAA